jgi:signal transduction histidine kinase
MKPQAKLDRVEIIVSEPLFVPTYILLDGDRFQQVLLNLLTNAIKFSIKRGGKVTVDCHGTPERQPTSL